MPSPVWPLHTWRCLRVLLLRLILYCHFFGVHRVLGGKAFFFFCCLGGLGCEALKVVHSSFHVFCFARNARRISLKATGCSQYGLWPASATIRTSACGMCCACIRSREGGV